MAAERSENAKRKAARGRQEAAVVRRYLEALERYKPKRGRKRTPESIKKRLDKIEAQLSDASELKKLQLVQERMDLERELERLQTKEDLSDYEKEFVDVAKGYSERKGIEYMAWREMGVPAEVLRRAGVRRTRRTSAAAS